MLQEKPLKRKKRNLKTRIQNRLCSVAFGAQRVSTENNSTTVV